MVIGHPQRFFARRSTNSALGVAHEFHQSEVISNILIYL